MKGSEYLLPHDVVCKNLILGRSKSDCAGDAMGEAEIEKLCKHKFWLISSLFVLFAFTLSNHRIFALSVDYSRHHCNHEHPKAHEASWSFSFIALWNSTHWDGDLAAFCFSTNLNRTSLRTLVKTTMYGRVHGIMRNGKQCEKQYLTTVDYDTTVRWWYPS